MNATDLRQLYPGLENTIYLNTATMAAGNAPGREAYMRAVDHWSAGTFDCLDAERAGDEARAIFAQMIFQRFGAQAMLDRNAQLSIPVADTHKTMARLKAAGVVASVRAGRVRLSVHAYNLEGEIDRAAELLEGSRP